MARDVAYIACQGGTLRVFAGVSALDGSVPATVVLSGDLTGLGLYTCGVTVDTLRDEVYVAVGVPENRVNVFPGASGLKGALNLEPARKLEGSATLFNGPTGLFFHRP